MKKLISLILALVMVLSFAVTAFAEDSTEPTGVSGQGNGGGATANVNGTYVPGAVGGIIYSVDITWTSMSFTYYEANEKVWDPETHTYSQETAAGWATDAAGNTLTGTITITNHSNNAIKTEIGYQAGDGYGTADMEFTADYADNTIASAAPETGYEGEAVVGTVTVTPTGKLTANATDGVKIGQITITINGV